MTEAAMNTDREIWREREGDAYADSIHVTEKGAIGINCGGTVYVKPVRDWHALASAAPSPDVEEVERVAEAIYELKPMPDRTNLRTRDFVPWSEVAGHVRQWCLDQARAAIAAMRPTLSEEDRARVEEVRATLLELDCMNDDDGHVSGRLHEAGETLLSLIDKLTNQEPPE